jgi:hypothetical protein
MRFLHICTIALLCCSQINAQKSTFSGKVIEKDTKEAIIFGTIAIYQKDILIKGTDTDFNGNFNVFLDSGKYTVVAKYLGMADKTLEIDIKYGKDLYLNIEIEEGGPLDCGPITTQCFQILPLVNISDPFSGQSFIPSNGFLKPNVGSSY